MIKTMNARYPGRDAHTGQRFSVGAEIRYDTVTRKAWLSDAPIRADYVGKNIPTAAGETVEVRLKESEGKDEVVICEKAK